MCAAQAKQEEEPQLTRSRRRRRLRPSDSTSTATVCACCCGLRRAGGRGQLGSSLRSGCTSFLSTGITALQVASSSAPAGFRAAAGWLCSSCRQVCTFSAWEVVGKLLAGHTQDASPAPAGPQTRFRRASKQGCCTDLARVQYLTGERLSTPGVHTRSAMTCVVVVCTPRDSKCLLPGEDWRKRHGRPHEVQAGLCWGMHAPAALAPGPDAHTANEQKPGAWAYRAPNFRALVW